MSTAFSHGIVGATFLPFVPKSFPRVPILIALIVLPMLPDLDVIGFKVGIAYSHWLGHRGLTHSLFFAVLLGFGAALVARRIWPASGDWRRLGLVLTLAVATHGVIDAMTDSGLGIALLAPFDNERFFSPFRPLPTPSLGIRSFFRGDPLGLLWAEAVRIWLPMLGFAAVLWLVRRARGNG